MITKITLFLLLIIGSISLETIFAQRNSYKIPEEKMLLIIGQDMEAIGGFMSPSPKGYVNRISIPPGGVTTYTSLPDLTGINALINYGSGDICAQCIVKNKRFSNAAIVIGIYMVDSEEKIARGLLDHKIRLLGEWIKAQAPRPIFLRIGYEFDGYWNHYQPEWYKKAFVRFVTVLDDIGVKNYNTVWQSSTSPVDDLVEGKHENLMDWYPGDEYVDYMGYSWFLNNEKQYELTDELVNLARERNKPVMVAESSPQGYDLVNLTKRNIAEILDGPSGKGMVTKTADQIWSEWFVPFFEYIHKNKDVVKMVAYINVNWDAQQMWGPPYAQGYWGDSRVQANRTIKKKWLEEIQKPIWLHSQPNLHDLLLKK
jgi:hypothetical protein